MSLETDDAMGEVVHVVHTRQHPMRNEDHAHAERIIDLQGALIRRKYAAGRAEHGGSLWTKPGMLAHAIDEVTDLNVYLLTLRDQVSHIAADLRSAGITPEDAADALDRLLRQ